MSEVKEFQDIDRLCLEARKIFRSHLPEKQGEVEFVFSVCLDLLRSIGKFKKPEEWEDSREEYTLSVLIQAIETVLAMYYLSESGFWDNSLALKRNVAELILIAVAIGYDRQCFVDWKHERDSFNDYNKILRRVQDSTDIPDIEKSLLPHLKRYWLESSQLFSHNIRLKSIRTLPKGGQFKFEPKLAEMEFQEKRLHTIRNMLIDIISISLGIFEYDAVVSRRKSEFPEAPEIIRRCNKCMQNEDWRKQETA
ncbi:MAG: hypothetical protein MUO89_08200 [Dehalococcoidia bacterium]|nr:hypothetical protein [Dehalococcoidia bacterium]